MMNQSSSMVHGKRLFHYYYWGDGVFIYFLWSGFFLSLFIPTISLLPIFLKLMSLLIVVILLSNFFAMVYLPCSGNTLFLSRVLIFVSIVSVVVAPILIWLYAGYGAVISAIFSELLVLILCYGLYLKLKHKL